MMLLSGKDIANNDAGKLVQDVRCNWCEKIASIELGPQHVGQSDFTFHCNKCGSMTLVKTGDKWFDQHTDKMKKDREVWKHISPDAYVTVRRGMQGAMFIWTIYTGTGEPREFFARDSLEHLMEKEFEMSWAQINEVLQSAALTPGRKIYIQKLTKISSQLEGRKITAKPDISLIRTGASIRINGKDGLFLRYSHNEGFSVVAFPGVGDAEVPTIELEVLDMADEPGPVGDFELEDSEHEEHEEAGLEEALDHIEQAEEIVEDLVLEEGSTEADYEGAFDSDPAFEMEKEHGEFDEVEPNEEEEDEEEHEENHDARRRTAMPLPGAQPAAPSPDVAKVKNLYNIINDPNTDSQTRQQAQRMLQKVKNAPAGPQSGPITADRKAFWNKIKREHESMDRPDQEVWDEAPEPKEPKSKLFPREGEEYPEYAKDDENLDKKANKQAQRSVHTQFQKTRDLKGAISFHRNELSIADIREILAHYVNTGKIARHESDDMAEWFIGHKPRLLSANDNKTGWRGEWRPPGHEEREERESPEPEEDKEPNKNARNLLSVKDTGEVNIPDSHPESGLNSGSASLDTPNPKWQSGNSANSVSGPEKADSHGVDKSPKDSGDVDTPNLTKARRLSFKRQAVAPIRIYSFGKMYGITPPCNFKLDCTKLKDPFSNPALRPLNGLHPAVQQAVIPSAEGLLAKADQAVAKGQQCVAFFCMGGSHRSPSVAEEFSRRLRAKGIQTVVEHLTLEKDTEHNKKLTPDVKGVLSTSDMHKKALLEKGIGVFTPATYKGKEVLIIGIDNTGVKATVQSGGRQYTVDVVDLTPTSKGPYSGKSRDEGENI